MTLPTGSRKASENFVPSSRRAGGGAISAGSARIWQAMDFPLDPISSMPIYAMYPAEAAVLNLQGKDWVSSNAGPVAAGAAELGNLVGSSGVADVGSCMAGLVPLTGDSGESTRQHDPQAPGWKKRVRVGRAPLDRTHCAERQSALEKSVRCYAEKLGDEVIDPLLGNNI